MRDLTRTLPAVVLLVVLAGAPIAYVLSRSVTGPLRRLATATADLPAADPRPLPLEGPTEVRELTDRFNAMAAELAETREREARLLADLRHDLRTPLTVIGGFAAALSDGTAVGDDAVTAARAIGEEAARLERLVAELEALERLRDGAAGLRPERLDAAVLLHETVTRFAPSATAAGVELGAIVDGPAAPATRLALRGRPAGRRADPRQPRRQRARRGPAGRPRLARGPAGGIRRTVRPRPAWRSASPTTARASRRATSSGRSSGSTGATPAGPGPGPGSGWRSSGSSPGPTVARPSPRTSRRTARGSA